jgi:hypothetical protein
MRLLHRCNILLQAVFREPLKTIAFIFIFAAWMILLLSENGPLGLPFDEGKTYSTVFMSVWVSSGFILSIFVFHKMSFFLLCRLINVVMSLAIFSSVVALFTGLNGVNIGRDPLIWAVLPGYMFVLCAAMVGLHAVLWLIYTLFRRLKNTE